MKNVLKQFKRVPCFILLFLSFFSPLPIWAQNRVNVHGMVIDTNKEPVIGATIRVMGNEATGTVTDIDGRFTLNVPNEQSILIGISNQKITYFMR